MGNRKVSSLTAAFLFAVSGMATFATGTLVSGGSAIAQEGGVLVQQVLVRGNQRIEADTVRSYLIIQPGSRVDQQSLDVALKTLFATGLFKDVNLSLNDNVVLVEVEENPIVNRVIFEGNKQTKEDKFNEEIQLAPRAVYTVAKVQSDVQRVIEVYRRSGRFAATVTPKTVQLPQNRVDIIFEIDEGPTTGVAKVNFSGNEVFSDKDLRDVVLTSESRWYKFFESNDNYDPDRLEYDRELLRQHYTRLGYADFQVVAATAELTSDRGDFFISFQVEEGPKYDFGKINVKTTLSKVNESLLERSLPIRSGTTFNSELIENAVESITYATGISGYAFVDVNPRLTRNEEAKTVDITFEVNEGPRVYVERINIGGNTRTLDPVIRREINLVEGDAFNRVLVDRSQRRVNGLGFFSDVAISELPGSAPDRTVLDVQVAEQSTGSFSVGAGISSQDSFIANLSVSERNLLGRGQFLQLDLRASARTQSATVRFREPYFLGRNLAAGFDLFSSSVDFEESGFVRDSLGAGVNMSFPVSDSGRLGLSYTLRNDNLEISQPGIQSVAGTLDLNNPSELQTVLIAGATPDDITVDANGQQVVRADFCDFVVNQLDSTCESRGEFLTSAVGYSLNYNKLNNPFLPSRGWRIGISQAFSGLGGDVQNLKTTVQGAYYRPLPFDFVGALKFDVGYVDGWGDDNIRISDRFFKGGASFRGFEVAGVGPRRVFQDGTPGGGRGRALGAKTYAVGSLEARIPLPIPDQYDINTSLFTDFGTVGIIDEESKILNDDVTNFVDFNGDGIFDEPIQDDMSIRVSAGISIDWRSPFGPVRIDLAEVLIQEDYDQTEAFRFSAGGQF
ncbi:outer membrane protein assembly factor BamA [Parvularcula sp. IMCC14364]|uniref:outer membrane protein assembly factor BamA n=1 Tax=Parvularcula sp. IMCC14364 TaxID=3067902 RepID=UPI0027418EE7|nr:outer membrane protein assembly factor BamA [Parvularcula sp. IMCC14364]